MSNVGSIAQLTQVKLPDGRTVNLADFNHVPIWSTGDFLTGFDDERLELFTYVAGDPVASTTNISAKRVATDSDTNVAINNGMASTEDMFVYSIQVEYIELGTANGEGDDITDATTAIPRQDTNPIPLVQRLAIFQYSMKFELEVSQKVKFESPLAMLSTGFGPVGSPSSMPTIAATPTNAIGNAGLQSNEAVRRLSVPVFIGQQEKYLARLRNPTSNAVNFGAILPSWELQDNSLIRARVIFDGLHKIPVA